MALGSIQLAVGLADTTIDVERTASVSRMLDVNSIQCFCLILSTHAPVRGWVIKASTLYVTKMPVSSAME